jgi:hypothetical protein
VLYRDCTVSIQSETKNSQALNYRAEGNQQSRTEQAISNQELSTTLQLVIQKLEDVFFVLF